MTRKLLLLLLLVLILAPATVGSAQPSGLPVDVPREELFIADQIYRFTTGVGNYNLWGGGGDTPHRHALMMETLWISDSETGERIPDAAAEDPQYNDDFTQMTVKLRDNIYWSDGVQFTADDLVFTVETLMANPTLSGSGWSAALNQFVESVEKLDDFTVQFNLNQSAPRFHYNFEPHTWNGIYMMPKHIWENVEGDPVQFRFENPVVLGAYVPIQYDENGYWELYERREDWDRTPAGIVFGTPGPKYVLIIFYGDSAKKVIAMSRGELDVYFDVDYEAFQTTLSSTQTARSWYTEFPWAYPNELNSRMYTFNYESDPIYQNKDVRWALALALNIVEIQTEYIGGVAKISVLPGVPSTSKMMELYFDPLEEWLQSLEIEIEPGEMYKPYDPTVPDQISAWAEEQGYTVPGEPRDVFGSGWWNYAPDVAERLLVKNGFSRDGSGNWLKPDGQPWTINLIAAPDEPDAFRLATAASDMWSDFGIEVSLQSTERSVWDQSQRVGQFDVSVPWGSWPDQTGDVYQGVRSLHSNFYVPVGEDINSKGGGYITAMRLKDPKIDEFIDTLVGADPTSPDTLAMTQDFLKYWTENMFFIQTIAFKKFVTWDERYWTGFPTAENPHHMPLYWFQGGKSAFELLTPAQ